MGVADLVVPQPAVNRPENVAHVLLVRARHQLPLEQDQRHVPAGPQGEAQPEVQLGAQHRRHGRVHVEGRHHHDAGLLEPQGRAGTCCPRCSFILSSFRPFSLSPFLPFSLSPFLPFAPALCSLSCAPSMPSRAPDDADVPLMLTCILPLYTHFVPTTAARVAQPSFRR